MTMTSMAVGPGSLGVTPNMLTPKRYHLQQGVAVNSPSPTSNKNYDTFSKGKKSWSVRLGLSRQSHQPDDSVKGWGTISGGSALSRQMIYGDPWIYGTVRSNRPDPRAFLTPPPHGAPVLVVCSCPEFLSGTTRKLGNCRKCGGHRFAGIPIGGTCRIPTTTRTRPSLAGILRPTTDDPYDLMRRSRLIEPRSRARSISPHRQTAQRDSRSLSVARNLKECKNPVENTASRTEWFDTEETSPPNDNNKLTSNNNNFSSSNENAWIESTPLEEHHTTPGRIHRLPKKSRSWQETGSISQVPPNAGRAKPPDEDWKDSSCTTSANDSRRSILECNVNPYLLVKNRLKVEDDLSDDLSDNALESEDTPSSLFDPTKVKSIERIPNRSSVAAIGGQRIRVFNEPREVSDEDEIPLTRIPIPKVSPKRPPRRLKEARNTLKSILKRGKGIDGKRKNVLFNVDNVIFAPEKPPEVYQIRKKPAPNPVTREVVENVEDPIIPEEKIQERPRFITIPNIRDPKRQVNDTKSKLHEAKIVPSIKSTPPVDRIKIDKFVPSKKFESLPTMSQTHQIKAEEEELKESNERIENEERRSNLSFEGVGEVEVPDVLMNGEVEKIVNTVKEQKVIEASKVTEPKSTEEPKSIDPVDVNCTEAPDVISDASGYPKITCLTRSQSDRSSSRPEMSACDVTFVDTMRLSLCRRTKDEMTPPPDQIPEEPNRTPSFPFVKNKFEQQCNPIVVDNRNVVKDQKVSGYASEIKSLFQNNAEKTVRNEPILRNNDVMRCTEQFRRMRPTSWSPPPGKPKHVLRDRVVSDPGSNKDLKLALVSSKLSSVNSSSKIDIGSTESNICKITVSPKSPLIHRLQVGGGLLTGAKRTSILINGDQSSQESDNKVTISVGGEDSMCNPTVISVNSDNPRKIQNSTENRTLVILDNYGSNIVVESRDDKKNDSISKDEKLTTEPQKQNSRNNCKDNNEPEETPRWTKGASKEAMISKLLEDSLRKARENGEILDESSGEAILKILKQSLLKSKEYESSESTIVQDTGYSRSSSLNSEGDFVSTNLFLEENTYEVIKEPIYEEIPDEPPPLPLSPPPTEDFIKDRLFFGDEYKEAYYKKVNSGQFLGSYLTDDIFKKDQDSYLSKNPDDFFKKVSASPEEDNLSTKFELLNFLMDSKERVVPTEEEEEENDDEEEEDAERDLEALYEQKETSLGDLSSKSSQISNVSDSSEECNIILASSPETLKARTVDIERTDSGVGSESSQASSGRGVGRRWRAGNGNTSSGSLVSVIPQVTSGVDTKLCEDCEQRTEPLITDSGVIYSPLVCRKCSKKRAERKEIITEIVETEQKYGRDLQIILEEFHRPMLRAGLLNQEQLSAIFLNVEELLEHNIVLAEKLKDSVEFAQQESGDEDLVTVDLGKIFLESERMLHAFESYCTRQGSASLLLQNLEKEKELLRIFLKVSQMENTVLRRMNLNSFLMVPVQRVTKYPLLLARLLKATPSIRPDVQEAKKRLKQAQTNIELHLEHMNAEAKDVTSTRLWRRISIIQNGRRSTGEQDMVNIKLRKMAVEVLEWAHEEARFVLEGRLLVAQPTDNNWRRGRTVKLAPITAMLVTNGKPNTEFPDFSDECLFQKPIGIKEATLLLVKEKLGRYSLLREPLNLDKCIVCCETDLEDYFEIQELSSKETFIFKAEDGTRTKRWCRTLQAHAQSLGAWRRRRGALPNIMICGVTRS